MRSGRDIEERGWRPAGIGFTSPQSNPKFPSERNYFVRQPFGRDDVRHAANDAGANLFEQSDSTMPMSPSMACCSTTAQRPNMRSQRRHSVYAQPALGKSTQIGALT